MALHSFATETCWTGLCVFVCRAFAHAIDPKKGQQQGNIIALCDSIHGYKGISINETFILIWFGNLKLHFRHFRLAAGTVLLLVVVVGNRHAFEKWLMFVNIW